MSNSMLVVDVSTIRDSNVKHVVRALTVDRTVSSNEPSMMPVLCRRRSSTRALALESLVDVCIPGGRQMHGVGGRSYGIAELQGVEFVDTLA